MHIAVLFSYVVLIMGIATTLYIVYNIGRNNGKEEFKEMMFRNTLEDYQIMSLKKGFETYYIKINRLEKKDVVCKTNGMGNKYILKEEK
jgi:hypothetical protein